MAVDIKIENFLQRIQTTKGRMPTYFKEGSKIPKKYTGPNFIFKKGKLFDLTAKSFVIKNANLRNKPRFVSVSGNDIYSGLNEHLRIKIVTALKAQMVPELKKKTKELSEIKYPWSLSLVVRKPFGYANWDADNLWLYFKTFQDSLVSEGIVPDDNVRMIRDTGRIRFEPCSEKDVTSLTYTIEHSPYTYQLQEEPFTISLTGEGKPGDMTVVGKEIKINIGKTKILWPAVEKALRRVMFFCVNNFCWVNVNDEDRKLYKKFFDEFKYYNIPINHDERRLLQEEGCIK